MRNVQLGLAVAFFVICEMAIANVKTPNQRKSNPVEYDFRGATLGMSLFDFRATRFPDADKAQDARLLCSSDQEISGGKGMYFLQDDIDKQAGLVECKFFTPGVVEGFWNESMMQLGTTGVAKSVDYHFAPDPRDQVLRLYEIVIIAYATATEGAGQGLREKFGPPTTSIRDSVQNRMGAKFDHLTLTWLNPVSMIMLDSPSGDVETMGIVYHERRLYDYVKEARKKARGPDSSKM